MINDCQPRRIYRVSTGLVAMTLIMLCFMGLPTPSRPKPLPVLTEPAQFSAQQAFAHVKLIARQPHPTGTAENERVRSYLLNQLSQLGLQAQVQSSFGFNLTRHQSAIGWVHNIAAKLPGKKAGKALILTAHYDSTHTGPGAADNSASVAAILEALRVLKQLPALQNDVICLFTDGEEAGLLGAEAFVSQHPWAKNVGLVLNFDYRGNRGSLLMFETSSGNGQLISGLAKAKPLPLANSLMYEVYQRLPNNTDLTVFKQARMPGMNFAAIDGHTSYHTQLDRPERLEQKVLQNQGELILSLARYFGNADLANLQSDDRVYFDVAGFGLVSYPLAWLPFLVALIVVVIMMMLRLGHHKKQLRLNRTFLGLAIFLLTVPLLAVSCQGLWLVLYQLHPGYRWLLQGDTYNSQAYFAAFIFLALALSCWLQIVIRRWVSAIEFATGSMIGWLLLLIATSLYWPGASFILFWPLAPLALTTGWSFLTPDQQAKAPRATTLILLGSVPGLILAAPFIKTLWVALTLQKIGVTMGLVACFLGLYAPLINLLTQISILPWTLLLFSLAGFVIASLTSGFDSMQPRPSSLFYALNSTSRQAFWLSQNPTLDAWTRHFIPSATEQQAIPAIFGDSSGAYWSESAPLLTLPEPLITVLSDKTEADSRVIRVEVKSQRDAPELKVFVEGATVLESKVQNRLFSATPESHWHLTSYGLAGKALQMTFAVKAGQRFRLRVTDFTYELPQALVRALPRPEDMIMQPFGYSDTTAVVNTIVFN